tara:strand:+ start:5477 stop:5647 length:171 start_codon:yes stop_codon:yes gene_type:complete
MTDDQINIIVEVYEEIIKLKLHEYQRKQLAMLLISSTLTEMSAKHIASYIGQQSCM